MNRKREKSLTKLAEAAFLHAAHEVIEVAQRTGTPVIVCEDGEIKKIDPGKIRLPPTRTLRSRNKK